MAPQVWPRPGHHVRLRVLGTETVLDALVEEVEAPTALRLCEPYLADGSSAAPPVPGTRLLVTWATAAGQHELLAVYAGTTRDRVLLWDLDTEAEPVVQQRRQFARAADAMPAQLLREGDIWDVIIADLSEGGARCVVLSPAELVPGQMLELRMTLHDHPVAVQAELLALDALQPDRATARLRFVQPGRAADMVRRRVLEQQRKARAAEVRGA